MKMDIEEMERDIVEASKILDLPEEIQNRAVSILSETVESKGFAEYSENYRKKIVAAVIAITCRQTKNPRTFSEIAKALGLHRIKGVKRTVCDIVRALGIKLSPVSPVDFVPRFCEQLGLDSDIQSRAIKIIHRTEKSLVGRRPASIAATAIYIASSGTVTPREIHAVTGVTEITVEQISMTIRTFYPSLF